METECQIIDIKTKMVADVPHEEKSILEIVYELDKIRKKADQDGLEEVAAIVNSTFEICYNSYYIMMRKRLTEYS